MREQMLWCEKYRPEKISDCVLPESIKSTFQEFANQGKIPNLLIAGSAGVGKTTIAKALCKEVGCDYIVINGSDENGIDVLRGKIKNYASSVSLSGGRKVVIIDEADYLNCLEENEEIRIGTLDNWSAVSLNQLPKDSEFPVVSMNLETSELENDTGFVVSDTETEVFEVELEDGSTVIVTADHPFITEGFVETTISSGLINSNVIVSR